MDSGAVSETGTDTDTNVSRETLLDGLTLPDYELLGGETSTEKVGDTVYEITTNYYLPVEYFQTETETLAEESTLYLVDSVWSDLTFDMAVSFLIVSLIAGFVLSSLPHFVGLVIGKITNYIPKNLG